MTAVQSVRRSMVDELEAALRSARRVASAHAGSAEAGFDKTDYFCGLTACGGEVVGSGRVAAGRDEQVGDERVGHRLDEIGLAYSARPHRGRTASMFSQASPAL